MPEKKNLVVYDLRYYEHKGWALTTGGAHVWVKAAQTKERAIRDAAWDLRDILDNLGQESELRVHTRGGKFSFARTYGHDPKSPG